MDLAGSESVKRCGFELHDQRFQESRGINSSLSVLGRCLDSLQSRKPSLHVVPWRESTLTKILWDFLKGKGYVSMIVTAHIVDADYPETMRALELAAKSQNIKMNPVVNSVRPSTRHKSRISKTPALSRDNSREPSLDAAAAADGPSGPQQMAVDISAEVAFMNKCTHSELKQIAIASYRAAETARVHIRQMKAAKVKLIESVLKHPKFQNIQSIKSTTTSTNQLQRVVEEPSSARSGNIESKSKRSSNAMDVDGEGGQGVGDQIEAALSRRDSEWESKMTALKNEHSAAITALKLQYTEYTASSTESMDALKQQHVAAVEALKAQHHKMESAMSGQMMQNELTLQSKSAEIAHLYAEQQRLEKAVKTLKDQHMDEMMQHTFKYQEADKQRRDEMEGAAKTFELKIADLEHDLKRQRAMNVELEGKLDEVEAVRISMDADNQKLARSLEVLRRDVAEREEAELQMEGRERVAESKETEWRERERALRAEVEALEEGKKALMIQGNKSENMVKRYKAKLDEAEQGMERMAHSKRAEKEKMQQQMIRNSELEENDKKMTVMMQKLSVQFGVIFML